MAGAPVHNDAIAFPGLPPKPRRRLDSVRYQVLGPVTSFADGDRVALGGPKQRLVLALLLENPGRSVPLDRLIDGVWADDPPDHARHTLQAYISELRRVLEDPIEWTGHGYRLAADPDHIDSALFERLLDEGRKALPHEPDRSASALRDALELWRGEPFADLQDTPALDDEVRRLVELRLAALEERIEAELALGHHRAVVEELETLTREHPFRERFRGQHMIALYRCGRQAEALRAFHKTRRILAEELGVDPSPELQRLEVMMLQQDPGLDTPPPHSGAERLTGAIRGFELREVIGEGGSSIVYRAFQSSMGREVAVKAIRPDVANNPDFVRRFEAEAQYVARLEHPHIVALYDFWRDPEGAYLVMQWLRGGNVIRALERGRWSVPATLRLIEQLASALAYAHRHEVVHGAITPSNVLLDDDINAYLADFRVATNGDPRHPRTSRYLAPEIRSGEPPTIEGDVYALGMLTYHLLAGELPHDDPYPPVSQISHEVPADLDDILARATAPRAADRYSRVDDVMRDLRRAIGADVVPVAAEPGHELAAVRNPYKGLRAFHETDAGDFFGRDDLTNRVMEALREHRLVAVVGPSGCGKSSLVRAGVIPALRSGALPGSERWLIIDMFPGAYPFEELAAALTRVAVERTPGLFEDLVADARGLMRMTKQVLPRDNSQLLLVIDQFEEVFSMMADAALRRLLLDSLAVAASDPRGRVRVLITLRADYFDRPLEFHDFGALIEAGLVPVAVPSEAGIALAVSRPAQRVGTELEPGLVAEIVRDVANQPGGLPLLQHALTELFERRQGRLLTLEAYVESGGVTGALGRRAEGLFTALSDAHRRAAEQVFLRLVTVDEKAEYARRRVLRTELAALDFDSTTLDHVLHQFGAHRLLSFDHDPVTRGATVEVAHEALLREWSRLRGWIELRREDLLLHRRLAESMREWAASDRDPGFLLPGGRLDFLESWAARTDLRLTTVEREFLATSGKHEAAAQRRRRRRRWAVGAVLSTLTVLAVIAAGSALLQAHVARVQALTAAARSNLASQPELALILAIEAVDRAQLTGGATLHDATGVLHETLLAAPLVRSFPGTGHIAWSHSTNLLATLEQGEDHASVSIRNGTTDEEIAAVTPGHGSISGMSWSGDGRLLAITHDTGPAVIWELASEQTLAEIPSLREGGHSFPSFGAGDTLLVISDLPGDADCCRSNSVLIWDLETNAELRRVTLDTNVFGTHLNPVEPLLLVSEPETFRAAIWDVRTGEKAVDLGDQGYHNDHVRFSPDGGRAAVLGPEQVKVWDVASAEMIADVPTGAASSDMEWSPDGRLIATSGTDAVVRIVEVESGSALRSLRGAGGRIEAIEFGPGGHQLAAVSDEIRIWDLQSPGGSEMGAYPAGRPISHAAWTPDDSRVVTLGSANGVDVVDFVDATSGELLASISHPTPDTPPPGPLPPPAKVAVSPDGRIIAATLHGTTTLVIDAATLEPLTVLEPGGTPGSFSPNSRQLIVGDFEAAYVYDTQMWSRTATIRNRDPSPFYTWYYDVAFHPQGDVVFVADSNGTDASLTVWDVSREPTRLAELPVETQADMVSISADGRRVAAGDVFSGAVRVWDVDPVLAGRDAASAVVLDIDAADLLVGAVLNPDGTRLVTALGRGELAIWDVDSGERLYTVEISDGVANEPEFSAAGSRLLVPAPSGTVHVLTLDVDELLDIARSRVTRSLTDQECRIYLGEACPSQHPSGG